MKISSPRQDFANRLLQNIPNGKITEKLRRKINKFPSTLDELEKDLRTANDVEAMNGVRKKARHKMCRFTGAWNITAHTCNLQMRQVTDKDLVFAREEYSKIFDAAHWVISAKLTGDLRNWTIKLGQLDEELADGIQNSDFGMISKIGKELLALLNAVKGAAAINVQSPGPIIKKVDVPFEEFEEICYALLETAGKYDSTIKIPRRAVGPQNARGEELDIPNCEASTYNRGISKLDEFSRLKYPSSVSVQRKRLKNPKGPTELLGAIERNENKIPTEGRVAVLTWKPGLEELQQHLDSYSNGDAWSSDRLERFKKLWAVNKKVTFALVQSGIINDLENFLTEDNVRIISSAYANQAVDKSAHSRW